MLDLLKRAWDFLTSRKPQEWAKLSAHLFAPALVFAWGVMGVTGSKFSIETERAATISELKTEIIGNDIKPKRGIAVIVEPISSDFQIPIKNASSIWSSLDESTVRANADRVALDNDGLKNITPFRGINSPVAIVVEGDLGKDILVPGGIEQVDGWRFSSQRSGAMAFSVVVACVFGFGMSLASMQLSPADGENKAASQISAEPYKN